ncbi:GNAT acetyltransferase 2-domain-containing protein [Dunaliella salina]|uniref:RNA cytidine acetyltransferase n=1 Tax=Dunaliella salina TaxID=3046 RepID=A0ABQ7GZ04_DUNSA|nr:GNAT acetyltransferase 2-domain-containing protein [Dunaliella salina]|eukprot:KAF5839809.1 GNAT acetyltransferase 2-domain-containing protein [Dunaliella salina]
MRKKVDSRIRTLVENCVKTRHRSLFVIIGDKARDQVVNLHYMLSKAVVKARPNVLWCYKKELHLSSHAKKRMNQIKKMAQRGLLDPEKEDPFALFVASTQIRYCFYHETQNILGNTYGMCVLQDFEALTPNLLARTIETVEGGGMIVMLLSNMKSLKQLYSLTMDVHARLRTESHQHEGAPCSLASGYSLIKYIEPVPLDADGQPINDPSRASAKELSELAETLSDTQPAGSLVSKCRSLDQGRAVVTFLDAASEKALRSTVALTASRGRGKSAALGLAMAGAVHLGYANIFVTAPSPENLKTLFQFVLKGLDALGYKEHIDYDVDQSNVPAFGKAIVRVNIFRNHRQTVQYILPHENAKLAQAELLVIDEAAAIPLPTVRALLGPYLVFLCSTVNGYEGTGEGLVRRIFSGRHSSFSKARVRGSIGPPRLGSGAVGRTFREVLLEEPIRYAPGDPVEAWLHELLCLDAAQSLPRPPPRLPHPSQCELYYVQRDTLFSFHKASEKFLQQMVSLYVASHYKNTPNDLLLMADAPAHHMFALLAPVDETQNVLPDILAVVQVALEGNVSKRSAVNSLARGELPQGDLIPWTVGQQFQDPDFPSLSGARIVRLAVHPELPRAGYGTRCIELLKRYYQGEVASLDEDGEDEGDEEAEGGGESSEDEEDQDQGSKRKNKKHKGEDGGSGQLGKGEGTLLSETMGPRKRLPPLLVPLTDRKPERLHYLGVSYGLTQQLYNFWRKSKFEPLYLRQSPSETTGEHTVVMLCALEHYEVEGGTAWLQPFVADFKARFMSLLGGALSKLPAALALSILDPRLTFSEADTQAAIQRGVTITRIDATPFTPYDIKRLQAYANNLVDYHLVLDLLPPLTGAYFAGLLPSSLSYAQAAILLKLGLQRRDISELETELSLPTNQVLALFSKSMRKLYGHLRSVKEAAVERTLPKVQPTSTEHLVPHEMTLDDDLNAAAQAARDEMRSRHLQPEDLAAYAVAGADEDLAAAVGNQTPAAGGIVSVRASGGSANAAKSGGEGKKGSMLYAKQDSIKKRGRGTPSSAGKKGPKKQKK